MPTYSGEVTCPTCNHWQIPMKFCPSCGHSFTSNYELNYHSSFPQTLYAWLQEFIQELNAEEPNRELIKSDTEYFKRVGAWDTQMLIMRRLKNALNGERDKWNQTK